MKITLSHDMLSSIAQAVQKTRDCGAVLEVERVADDIRRQHIDDNVALEDVIEALVSLAGSAMPIKFGADSIVTPKVPRFLRHAQSCECSALASE